MPKLKIVGMGAKRKGNSFFILLAIAFILAVAFVFTQTKKETKDPVGNLFQAIDSLPENYSVSKSGLEWFMASVGLLPEGFIESTVISTTVKGEVVGVSNEDGKINISSKHYYVGEPGVYEYGGKITLTRQSGETKTLFFSPKRMEAMEVVRIVNDRQVASTFDEIKPGDLVEMEETVDLAKPNVNDDNLISITIRIL